MKFSLFLLIFIWKSLFHITGSIELITELKSTSLFEHQVLVKQDGQEVARGGSLLKISRPDEHHLILAAEPNTSAAGSTIILLNEVFAVMKTFRDTISSISANNKVSEWDLNYLRSLVSVLSIPEENWSRSYKTTTNIFGTCEATINRNSSFVEISRDLTTCSQLSSEVVTFNNYIPFLHLGMDLSGSHSVCSYRWKTEAKGILDNMNCSDVFYISQRFMDPSVKIQVESSLKFVEQQSISLEIDKYLEKASLNMDLTFSPTSLEIEKDGKEKLENLLHDICLSPEGHLSKENLRDMHQTFNLLRTVKNPLDVLKYPCPTHFRRRMIYIAALLGGIHQLDFVHDQINVLLAEGESILPPFHDPLISLAISNLAEIGSPDAQENEFANRETLSKYKAIIKSLLVAGPRALPGISNLLQKLQTKAPSLFEEILVNSALAMSPEEVCKQGNAEQATRILHAVSGLSVRHPEFIASLRSCFETDDIGVQVAAMMSLKKMNCQTRGVLELQKLVLESPSDPEIRIAAFRCLIGCLSSHPELIDTLKLVLDSENDNFSKQVASYVWSYLQTALVTTDPKEINLRMELENDLDISELPDPVNYDPRQHSRHIERQFLLDHRTSVLISFDLIWGRASPFPRSLVVTTKIIHNGVSYDMFSIFLRCGLEINFENVINLTENYEYIKDSVFGLLRQKRDINIDSIKSFIERVVSRIPADYLSKESSFQISIDLYGIPVFHSLHKDISLRNLTSMFEGFETSNYHAEVIVLYIYALVLKR